MENANNAERAAKLAEAEKAVAPYINALNDKTWAKLNHSERTEALQKIVDFEATVQDMPAPQFTSKTLPSNVRGKYGPTTNTIVQNKDCTLAQTSEYATKNALHETRHSYQHDCIQHPNAHPNESPQTIAMWKQASDNYARDAQNALTYLANPLEMDARNYSEARYSYYESRMNEAVSTRLQTGETMNQILVTPDTVQIASTQNQTSSTSEASHGTSPAIFGAESAAATSVAATAGEGHGNGIGR